MRKPLKNKKDKVPKITEAEYSEYISHLRECNENHLPPKENVPVKESVAKEE